MAKRVRDTEGGVSQCVACEAPQRSEARSSPTRRETPKKINVSLSDCLSKMEYYRSVLLILLKKNIGCFKNLRCFSAIFSDNLAQMEH